jgi:hypothetical protein
MMSLLFIKALKDFSDLDELCDGFTLARRQVGSVWGQPNGLRLVDKRLALFDRPITGRQTRRISPA